MYESGVGADPSSGGQGDEARLALSPYRIAVDEDGRIIRIVMRGLWNADIVTSYMRDLESLARDMRGRGRTLRVVVDVRDAPYWPKPVAALLTAQNRTFYKPGDRLALILHSSLSKVRARQQIVDEHQALFLSPKAAELWVSA